MISLRKNQNLKVLIKKKIKEIILQEKMIAYKIKTRKKTKKVEVDLKIEVEEMKMMENIRMINIETRETIKTIIEEINMTRNIKKIKLIEMINIQQIKDIPKIKEITKVTETINIEREALHMITIEKWIQMMMKEEEVIKIIGIIKIKIIMKEKNWV